MAYNRVAALQTLHISADVFDPTGIFMAHHVGQLNSDATSPQTLDYMQVCPTNPCTADANEDITIPRNLGIRDLLNRYKLWTGELLVILVEHCGFHVTTSALGI
jgi:hypothetical protein